MMAKGRKTLHVSVELELAKKLELLAKKEHRSVSNMLEVLIMRAPE